MKYFAHQFFLRDKKMLERLKKNFNRIGKYSLKITDIAIKNNDIICRINDKTNVNPYHVLASEIFKNDNLLSQIKPRELIKLKELYDEIKRKHVFVIETRRRNKYKILHHDHEFIMSGKDICKDMKLLKAMSTEEAFGIIYNTGYLDAIKNNKDLLKIDKQPPKHKDPDNIIHLKKIDK